MTDVYMAHDLENLWWTERTRRKEGRGNIGRRKICPGKPN